MGKISMNFDNSSKITCQYSHDKLKWHIQSLSYNIWKNTECINQNIVEKRHFVNIFFINISKRSYLSKLFPVKILRCMVQPMIRTYHKQRFICGITLLSVRSQPVNMRIPVTLEVPQLLSHMQYILCEAQNFGG